MHCTHIYIYIYIYIYMCAGLVQDRELVGECPARWQTGKPNYINKYMYIYIYIYIYVYIYIYIYIPTYEDVSRDRNRRGRPRLSNHDPRTANLRTKTMDFRAFDSSIILNLRGGLPRPMGNSPQGLSQAILVGIMLVGRMGVTQVQHADKLMISVLLSFVMYTWLLSSWAHF